MKVGEALFSDGLTARFRVLSHSPPSVRAIADDRFRSTKKPLKRGSKSTPGTRLRGWLSCQFGELGPTRLSL